MPLPRSLASGLVSIGDRSVNASDSSRTSSSGKRCDPNPRQKMQDSESFSGILDRLPQTKLYTLSGLPVHVAGINQQLAMHLRYFEIKRAAHTSITCRTCRDAHRARPRRRSDHLRTAGQKRLHLQVFTAVLTR